MSTTLFEQGIQDLNFTFIEESGNSGVLLTNNYQNLEKALASPDVLFALETAKSKFNADAVYFRFFQDGRASVPQLYIFDFTQRSLTEAEKNRIHVQMWNGYQVPAYLIIEKFSVSIFDSREKPKENLTSYASEIIRLTGTAIKDFKAQSFDDGLFWEEQDEKKHFKFEQSATKDLIRGLKQVYKSFQEESGLNRHVALKLLVQCLLIKYLEERDEDSASGYFAGTYFKRNFQCDNFCDTIRKGKLLNLLDQLSKDFNGKIFEWDKTTETEERLAIQKTEVIHLADYLDGNIQNSQYVLWRLYSFSHLPVEVISSVYEELLTDSKDIVYTPEMIVSTLVDECMPLKSPKQDFKLIDVSCGSGIFLVKSYKRIVQWWRYEQWLKHGELVKPPLSVLRELLLKSIHGIDIEPDAIRLSIFSLALAILDEVNLDPPTWGKLKFPDLSENIVTQDFFRFIISEPGNDFALVIGNPPFNLQSINGKEPDRTKFFKNLKNKTGYKTEISIPDENPALHFLVQSMKLLKQDGLLCLIQPSGPLLYKDAPLFKNHLFSKYNLLQVIDFTKLADKLWGRKNVATAAVFLQNAAPDAEAVLHLIGNRTFSNSNRLFLEFDRYDFNFISKEAVLSNPYIWKANLLGGGRLGQLIDRLAAMPTLGQFLKEKVKSGNWKYGEGYTIGNKKHHADFIQHMVSVKPEHFQESGVSKTSIETEGYFEAPREKSKEIYLKPHILIKENIGKHKIPIDFLTQDAVFSHEIIGIHAPESEVELLKEVYQLFVTNNSLYRFFILVTSNRVLVGRATAILKKDIDSLPFSLDHRLLSTSLAEKILIEDVLSCQLSRSQNQFEDTAKPALVAFAEVFCKTLNSVYQNNGKSFQLFKIIDAGKYYAIHFEYTADETMPEFEETNNLERYIHEIIPSSKEKGQSTSIQRILKIYGKDRLILVKPKHQRYWLRSIALRDADETFADYVKARYYAEG
ncbi:N-6 DNA methylase [Mucilaginibacter sp. KACC 22773]|uniref:Eco57I restriction-modification methylase domain-containing protein n=1 Tax=Mucilaginibacter sp. KACC 22773 TaxID=3025671 RepID=UPI0023656841|nr:N-6 DNA methylase [Mucilaginibacter sp. KACC 22773]WDF77236.1 N-6 DNA methylase [Mucilaginibacter sp. KACC 22773]